MISVLMGAHRFDEYTEKAIDSIFSQTLAELELIVIANGKFRDDVENKIVNLYGSEPRLRIIKSEVGQLSHALNIGIDNAFYEYIARMDSDDVAWPERLEVQLKYIREKGLDLVGSAARLIDKNDEVIGVRHAIKGASIDARLPFKNPFIHPSILVKKSALLRGRGYSGGFNSEDSDLWLRLKREGVKWDNIPETLLDYRIHDMASQGNILGYAEDAGYALREFLIKKNMRNLSAVFYKSAKAFLVRK